MRSEALRCHLTSGSLSRRPCSRILKSLLYSTTTTATATTILLFFLRLLLLLLLLLPLLLLLLFYHHIAIHIKRDTGEFAPCELGKVLLTLHFRQSCPLNFLRVRWRKLYSKSQIVRTLLCRSSQKKRWQFTIFWRIPISAGWWLRFHQYSKGCFAGRFLIYSKVLLKC